MVCIYVNWTCVCIFSYSTTGCLTLRIRHCSTSEQGQPLITGQHVTFYKTLHLVTPKTAHPITNTQVSPPPPPTRMFPAVFTICHISVLSQHCHSIHTRIANTILSQKSSHRHMTKPHMYDAYNNLQRKHIYKNTVWVWGHIVLTGTHLGNVRVPLCNIGVTSRYSRCVTIPVNERFAVLRAVLMKYQIFWDITLCVFANSD
jgi:hypothetical protein